MKIIIKDFEYKGEHFEECEATLPQITKLEDVPFDKLEECVKEIMDKFADE